MCGNAFLEPGEDCDCGTVEVCHTQTKTCIQSTQKRFDHNILNCLPPRNVRIPAAMQLPANLIQELSVQKVNAATTAK